MPQADMLLAVRNIYLNPCRLQAKLPVVCVHVF